MSSSQSLLSHYLSASVPVGTNFHTGFMPTRTTNQNHSMPWSIKNVQVNQYIDIILNFEYKDEKTYSGRLADNCSTNYIKEWAMHRFLSLCCAVP